MTDYYADDHIRHVTTFMPWAGMPAQATKCLQKSRLPWKQHFQVIPYDKKGPQWQFRNVAILHYKDMVPIYTVENSGSLRCCKQWTIYTVCIFSFSVL